MEKYRLNYENVEEHDKIKNQMKELKKVLDAMEKDFIEELKTKGEKTETLKDGKTITQYKKVLANGKAIVTYTNNPTMSFVKENLDPEVYEACKELRDKWTLKTN